MGSRKPETWAKRAREQSVKERRERKAAKKAAAAAARAEALANPPVSGTSVDATEVAESAETT
jgi:hypothetical protein